MAMAELNRTPIDPKELITVADVADAAGVSREAIYRWAAADNVATFIFGDRRKRHLRREDAEFLIRPRQNTGTLASSNEESTAKASGVAESV